MTLPLMEEFKHYEKIREELAKEHAGKFVAIKGTEILGIYIDYMAAARALYTEYERGTVFVQEIKAGKDGHKAIIYTPGLIAFK